MPKTHFASGLTKAQRRNLEMLYAYLATLKPESFNMAHFSYRRGEGELEPDDVVVLIKEKNYCGTVACLAGNGPAAGVKPRKDEYWSDYTKRVFGGISHWGSNPAQMRIWNWLFAGTWADTDNTIEGGRARIRITLDQGVPFNYKRQMLGDDKLDYSVPA